MNILVGCEFSGVVRDAFRALGHNAYSCDLLPTEANPQYHIVGDVITAAKSRRWDLGIFHPPCTYLCNSGIRWLYLNGIKANGPDPHRWKAMYAAAKLYNDLLSLDIDRIAVENPRMHIYAIDLCGEPTQFIHPWQHGENASKETGLRLKNLPKIVPSDIIPSWRTPSKIIHNASPGPDRWKIRSRTFQGIANAIANQWGNL